MVKVLEINDKFEKPVNTIAYQTNKEIQNKHEIYPQLVEILARIVHLLGKLGLAFRGHRESLVEEGNTGNVLEIVKEIANHNVLLKEHIEKTLRKDTTSLGPKIQNELIDLIGKKIIQAQIVEEIKKSKIHAISANEVTSSNDEIMSICFSYVDDKLDICELFSDFVELERITGEHIGNRLLNFYEEVGCGQCYDGAANMQSQKEGADSFILKESPNALITHCCPHNLKLLLASSCKIPIIDNVLEMYKSIIIFSTRRLKEKLY